MKKLKEILWYQAGRDGGRFYGQIRTQRGTQDVCEVVRSLTGWKIRVHVFGLFFEESHASEESAKLRAPVFVEQALSQLFE